MPQSTWTLSDVKRTKMMEKLKFKLTCFSNIPITLRSTKNFLRCVAITSTALCTPEGSPCTSTTLSSGRAKTGRFSTETH